MPFSVSEWARSLLRTSFKVTFKGLVGAGPVKIVWPKRWSHFMAQLLWFPGQSCAAILSWSCLVLQASRVWVQNKVDESKHEIHSQVDAITAGTASVVNLTAGKSLRNLWCIVILLKTKVLILWLKQQIFPILREESIFRPSQCFRRFLPLTQEKCGEHLIPFCLYHASSVKTTYPALLIVRQAAGHTSKCMEASFSLLRAYSLKMVLDD